MGRKDLGRYFFSTNPRLTVQALSFCTLRVTHNFKLPAVVYLDERDGTYHVRTQADFLACFTLCPKAKAVGHDGSS